MEPVHLLVAGPTSNIMPLPSTTNEKSIIDQILRRSKLTSTAVSIINRLLQRTIVETIDGNKSLTINDSGKFFVLDSTSAVTITLPLLSTDLIGTTYTFAIITANDNSYKITTPSAADSMKGYGLIGTSGISATLSSGNYTNSTGKVAYATFEFPALTATSNGRIVTPGAGEDTINIDADRDHTGGEKGCTVKLTAITSTVWYCEAIIITDDTNANGVTIFTNENT